MGELRVLQVNVDDCNFGGVYSLVTRIQQILYDTSNIRFDFLAFEEFQNDESVKKINRLGGNVYCINYKGNKIFKQYINFIRAKNFFKANPYKVVHIHSDLSFKLFIPSFAAKINGVEKIIIHSHSTGADGTKRTVKKLIHYLFKPLLSKTADYYLSCSKKAGDWMYTKSCRKKAQILYNGVNTEDFKYSPAIRSALRERNNLSDKFVIGHVGGFKYVKNHFYLLEIFKEFLKEKENAVLLLIGEGELYQEVEQRAAELGLTSNVLFWGISYEVHKLYQMMDFFLLPSFFEGLPLVGVEAQAIGLPVIFSDKITEEVKITENAYFLSVDLPAKNWSDKIIEISENFVREDLSGKIAESGYDLSLSAKTIESLYSN